MTKHTEAIKLQVVEAYLTGMAGIKTIAMQYGVDKATVQKWVASYRMHGTEGLEKKFSHYNGKFKLLVLKHMWDNELSYRETAAVFNIRNHSCLADWEERHSSGGIKALEPRKRGRPKKMSEPGNQPPPTMDEDKRSREELLAELKYLRMENDYLKKLEALVQAKGARTKRK